MSGIDVQGDENWNSFDGIYVKFSRQRAGGVECVPQKAYIEGIRRTLW